MRRSPYLTLTLAAAFAVAAPARAQKQEVGLTLGHLFAGSRTSPLGALHLGGGVGFQANYGHRLVDGSKMALYAETHFLANSLREVTSVNRSATRDVATLYVTPGLRVKFVPRRSLSPYAVVGAGYGLYEQSFFQIDGASNPAPRFTHRGAFAFGGGLDLKVWLFLGASWEVRDFYSWNPSFNAPTRSGGQHNVVIGGGFTLHLR